jgi:WS/DGAT/MGAT family acyltransferase
MVTTVIDDAAATARFWWRTGTRLAINPARTLAIAAGLGGLVRPSAIAPRTSLNRPVGNRRRLVPLTFELADLKDTAHRYGVTVNDLLLALVGSGLHELLERRGEDVDHVQALVPFSMRGDTEHNGAGNRVGALIVPISIERDPIEALGTISAAAKSRKGGPEAAALAVMLEAADTWPMGLLGPASRQIVDRQPFVNLVVTNVRGREQPLSLLGSRITEIVPVVPLGGRLSLGVAALSFDRRLVVGLHADADACPDVDLVARGIERAWAKLEEATKHRTRAPFAPGVDGSSRLST